MSSSYSNAVEHLTVENIDINLAMKKLYCVLPLGILGSNGYGARVGGSQNNVFNPSLGVFYGTLLRTMSCHVHPQKHPTMAEPLNQLRWRFWM